jgi:hypothetical protein
MPAIKPLALIVHKKLIGSKKVNQSESEVTKIS